MSAPSKAQSSGSATVLGSEPGSGSVFIGLVTPFAAGIPATFDTVPSILATAGGRWSVSYNEEKSCLPSVLEAILLSSSSLIIAVWSANESQSVSTASRSSRWALPTRFTGEVARLTKTTISYMPVLPSINTPPVLACTLFANF